MPWQEFSPLSRDVKFEPERAVRLGVGVAATPIFAAFFAAAATGVTWWWMTSWTRRAGAGAARAVEALPTEAKSFAEVTPEPEAEAVMAHQPEPELAAEPAQDTVTADLATPPEEVMEHAPVQAAAVELETPSSIDLASVVDEAPADAASTPEEAVEAAVAKVIAARPGARRKAQAKTRA